MADMLDRLLALSQALTAPNSAADAVDGVFSIHFHEDAHAKQALEAWDALGSDSGQSIHRGDSDV